MKTSEEIVAENIDEDGEVDFESAIAAFHEVIGAHAQVVTPEVTLAVMQMHMQTALAFIARQSLQALDQLGALPNGLEVEMERTNKALGFDFWRHMYDAVTSIVDVQGGGLIVPEGNLEIVRN